MNILNYLTIKHLKLNKRRTIVTIIGILLSTALMVGIGLICSSVREYSIDETKEKYGDYHALIKNVDTSKISILNNSSNIKKINYETLIGYSAYKESNNTYKPYYKVKAVNKELFNELKLTSGRYPSKEDEIVISKHIFNYSDINYKVGDVITLDIGNRYYNDLPLNDSEYQEGEYLKNLKSYTYKIVGIIERPNYTYEDYSDPGFSVYTLINNINNYSKVNTYISLKNIDNIYEYSKLLYDSLGKSEKQSDLSYNIVLLSLYGHSIYNNVNRFIASFMIIFLGILSVACFIVIYNSFAISVIERKKQFGLFSSIGATKKQIIRTILFEALIVGSIGIILGLISAYLGIGTVIVILNKLLDNVLTFPFKLVTYPLFIIIPIIFMILVILLSAFLPAYKASKISPINAIRQNDDIKINKRKIKTPKFISKIFGIEGDIALKNMKRNKKKYRITVISLFVSIVTFIAFSTYLEVGKKSASLYMGNVNYDIVASFNTNNIDEGLIDRLIKDPNTKSYLIANFVRLYVVTNENNYNKQYYILSGLEHSLTDSISLVVLDDTSYQEYKNKLSLKEDKPIIINYITYTDYSNNQRKTGKLEIFNTKNLTLNFCNLESLRTFYDDGSYEESTPTKEYLFNNCNYSLSNFYFTDKAPLGLEDGGYIIINNKLKDELLKYSKAGSNSNDYYSLSTNVYIKASKYDSLDKIGKEINAHSATQSYYNIASDMQTEKNILLAISILLYGFITLVTLIGVTSVFNTISTSIMLRKKEFSVLRSIGLTPRGFNKIIFLESLLFSLKALIFGIPTGLILSIIISNNMNMLVDNSYIFPLKAIIISIVGSLIITLITMFYTSNKIKKENILDSIREENI